MSKHDMKQLVPLRLTLEQLIEVAALISRVESHPKLHILQEADGIMYRAACDAVAPVPDEPTLMDRVKRLL